MKSKSHNKEQGEQKDQNMQLKSFGPFSAHSLAVVNEKVTKNLKRNEKVWWHWLLHLCLTMRHGPKSTSEWCTWYLEKSCKKEIIFFYEKEKCLLHYPLSEDRVCKGAGWAQECIKAVTGSRWRMVAWP